MSRFNDWTPTTVRVTTTEERKRLLFERSARVVDSVIAEARLLDAGVRDLIRLEMSEGVCEEFSKDSGKRLGHVLLEALLKAKGGQ